MQPVSKQRFGKHVSAATDTNTTIEERCFPCGPCRDVISRTVWSNELVVGKSCQQFTWMKWRKVAGWWERVELSVVSCQLSVGSQPVKWRLGDWCEMAATLGPSLLSCQLTSVLDGRLWQDLSEGNWRICLGRSRCQETVSGDCMRLRTLVYVYQCTVKCSSE
jgi:hypothetical protein